MILVALQKDASLRPTSKILLRNLTITDLCAGLISQPLAMTVFLSLITENWTFCRKAKYSAYIVTTIFSSDTDLHCSGETPRPVLRDKIWAS